MLFANSLVDNISIAYNIVDSSWSAENIWHVGYVCEYEVNIAVFSLTVVIGLKFQG